MRDKNYFLDTNVLVYTIDSHPEKKQTAIELLLNDPLISIQVINEFSNVLHKKFLLSYPKIKDIIENVFITAHLAIIDHPTINLAYKIGEKYKYSYYDSLIIASALENNCTILYSEDMHNGQLIENKLQIKNPFL